MAQRLDANGLAAVEGAERPPQLISLREAQGTAASTAPVPQPGGGVAAEGTFAHVRPSTESGRGATGGAHRRQQQQLYIRTANTPVQLLATVASAEPRLPTESVRHEGYHFYRLSPN